MSSNIILDSMIGLTTDSTIQKAIDDDVDVVWRIYESIGNDTENESMKLLNMYKDANEEERAILDRFLITLCGWSLQSIIENTYF